MTDTVSIKCSKCGSHDFKYEGGVQANLKADDTITCAKCGASGKYGPLMESAKKMVMDDVTAHFRKLFK